MFIDRRVDKQNVFYSYNGILLTLKKEYAGIHYNMEKHAN